MTTPTPNTVWHPGIGRTERWALLGCSGATVWLTGLSGAGKSTIAVELERLLLAAGRPAYLLDGDNLRHGINAGLGFTDTDRDENVRRAAEVGRLFADSGAVAIVALISPLRRQRDAARALHVAGGLVFCEVHVDAALELCEARDPKGLYAKARAGEITRFTGIDDPYEVPLTPELVLQTDGDDPPALATRILHWLRDAERRPSETIV